VLPPKFAVPGRVRVGTVDVMLKAGCMKLLTRRPLPWRVSVINGLVIAGQGMGERAMLVGGRLDIGPCVEEGTEVHLLIPVGARS
jgi:hypothetical protein